MPNEDKANILVVDDLPEKLVVYEAILAELGQNLVTVLSGAEALKLLLQQEFAVILLDVNMPAMDGFETAALIRKRRKSANTPIIFLTAFADELRMAQGYAHGAVDYIPTPVVPEILRAKVKVFIELFQMRQRMARQAEAQAKQAAAAEAARRKDEFLAMLGHELRNPLTPILNAVQILRLTTAKDADQQQVCDIIDRQVSHMARLVDDLLDATRIARGKILLRRELCDLAQIVRQMAEDYRSIFEAARLRLTMDIPRQPVLVEGDPTRLAQMVGNLLHNAQKYTHAGGRVMVNLKREGDSTAVIRVRDTGTGIDQAVLPGLFDVFSQADRSLDRSCGGLGLGLALVKGLANLHGGDVEAASEGLGKGAEFTIRLPAATSLTPDRPEPARPETEEEMRRILVIEDNRDAAESTQRLLSLTGHEVRTAASGREGLETARSFRPQIILCDIGLPGMDGYEVARAIRQDMDLSEVYIIALTGYGRDEDQIRAYEAGFDLHLTKPVDLQVLRRALALTPMPSV
jgi:signal transduction histidine kinase